MEKKGGEKNFSQIMYWNSHGIHMELSSTSAHSTSAIPIFVERKALAYIFRSIPRYLSNACEDVKEKQMKENINVAVQTGGWAQLT